MAVDINQTNQTINWLDEELRRSKALQTELRQKVESQSVEMGDQAKRIKELETRLSQTQGALNRFNMLEQAIQQLKDELVLMVRDQDESIQRHQKDVMQSRQLEQESSSRALNELRRSLEAIAPLQDKMSILKAEDLRLSEAVMTLQTRLTAHERLTAQLPDRIGYVEGQRAQDVKTVSRLQEETTELLRRVESLAGKSALVDDLARKNEQRLNALSSLREELTSRQSQLLEEIRLKEAQRDRTLQDWSGDISRYQEEMKKHRLQLEGFARKLEAGQQYLAAIDEYKNSIDQQQRQVAELQRLSEERQRREVEEWVAANEQRWTKFLLERDARWHQAESLDEEQQRRLKELETQRVEDLTRVHDLNKDLLGLRQEIRNKLREIWTIQERAAIFELDQVRRWYDEISSVVADRVDSE